MEIRFVRDADTAGLLGIYRPYVEETAVTFEWKVPTEEEFARRLAEIRGRYPVLAAEADGRLCGYAYAHSFVGRQAYDWAAEMTIYVAGDRRGEGAGGALYRALEAVLAEMNICNLEACIGVTDREDEYLTNDSARFHAHMGYRLVGKFEKCGYKFGRWYSMVWMEKIIAEHREPMPPVRNVNDLLSDIRR